MAMEDNFDLPFYQYKPQKFTDEELLEIFPKGKEIILQKIVEYQKERNELLNKMKLFRKEVKKIAQSEQKDDFFVWFWGYAYLKYSYAFHVAQIDKHLQRLYRQKRSWSKIKDKHQINEHNWEELKERAKNQSLIDIALPHLERVKLSESRVTALCPFHTEKTPSFVIYIYNNTFHCFGACQAHGDVITFVMRTENLSFAEAVRRLAA